MKQHLKQKIKTLSSEYFKEIVAIRRHIHSYPELSFQEKNTAKYISSKLKEYNIPFTHGIAGTGIVALLKGNNPSKKIIALRSDLDALPIIEENDISYKSHNKGIMHACGHDVHTAMLLGTAKILAALKNEWEGTVKFIFQPGEEKLPGGASMMIKEGVLENPKPDLIIGQHVFPELEVGKVGFKSGMYMASTDEIYLTVKGKGGHGALPHQLIDPVLISSQIVVALQQIISRNASPTLPSVLSFGKIIANGATNIIPDEVNLEGTFRTMNEKWREEAHQKIKQLAENIATGMGGSCDINIKKGYPFLVNNEAVTTKARQNAIDFLGNENVTELDMRMTSEDFAYYSQLIPACFYRIGTCNTSLGITSNLHTSTFNIDEKAIETGMGLMAWLAICD